LTPFSYLLEGKSKRFGRLLLVDAAEDANLVQAADCMNINGAGTLNGFRFLSSHVVTLGCA
jgi:hypothetical protein